MFTFVGADLDGNAGADADLTPGVGSVSRLARVAEDGLVDRRRLNVCPSHCFACGQDPQLDGRDLRE